MDLTLDDFMKSIQDLLLEAADALKDTADRMYNISKSIKKAEKEFRKIEITEDDIKTAPLVEVTPKEEIKVEPEEKKDLRTSGPPKRITPKATEDAPTLEKLPVKVEDARETEITKEKKSLFNITDKISGLLDKLKEKVVVSAEKPEEKAVSEQNEGLSLFKNQISNLNDRFKTYMKRDDFEDMTPDQRKKALKDMAEAINILTEEYKKDFLPKDI